MYLRFLDGELLIRANLSSVALRRQPQSQRPKDSNALFSSLPRGRAGLRWGPPWAR